MFENLIGTLVPNIAGAVGYAYLGWKKGGQPFDIRSFGTTVVISAIAGVGFSIFYPGKNIDDQSYSVIVNLLIGAGVPLLVQNAFRHLTGTLGPAKKK